MQFILYSNHYDKPVGRFDTAEAAIEAGKALGVGATYYDDPFVAGGDGSKLVWEPRPHPDVRLKRLKE